MEELLGRYHAHSLSYAQMKRTEAVTARIPIAADLILGSALVRELTTPLSLSIGAFPWDAEPSGRGKEVGNWLHRHYVVGKWDVYARLHHRYVLFDDLDEETWRLVGRTISLRSALQRAEVVKAGHLDEPAPLATANATLWDVAQGCARLSSLRRARERAGRHAAHGVMSRSGGFPRFRLCGGGEPVWVAGRRWRGGSWARRAWIGRKVSVSGCSVCCWIGGG
jgi:hypothetical protein